MAFIGNTNTTQAFTPAIDYFSGNGSTTAFTLSRPVASVAQVQVVIDNVAQNPSTAFTVLNNTITFTSAPLSGTNNIYVQYTSPITQYNAISQAPSVIGPMSVSVNSASGIGGATNPIVNMSASANNYVQAYVNNTSSGTGASADLVVYPNNGTDTSGWVDVGITSSTFSSAAYSITNANEGYLFMSAPSGASKTGNLVYATDSTGTTNSHQFYVGGFNQSKSAVKFTVSSTGAYGQLVSGTSVATTSGTSVDITGIPSWVKRITLMFSGVSLNGASEVMVQIGTSGGIQTSSYIGKYSFGGSYASISTGFVMYLDSVAGDSLYGTLTLNLFTDSSTGKWIGTGITSSYSGGVACGLVAGEKSLSGVLDRIRVTTLNGTDAFDAGSVNIMYEG